MSLKETLQVEAAGVAVGTQESAWKIKNWFNNLQRWQRVLVVTLLILLIPGYFAVRYGAELVLLRQYGQQALVAHSAFTDPDPLVVSPVSLIRNANNTITAYATVTNPNLDLGLDSVRYTVNFFNSSRQPVYSSSGVTYLLPDQQRWLVVPRVETAENVAGATIEFEQLNWQKRLTVPEVELRMTEPFTHQQDSPLATVTEGAVINNSPYNLRQVSLVLVLYDANNRVIGVTAREEFALQPFERRAYIVQWPGVSRSSVSRIGLEAYTNSLDAANLSVATIPN